MSIAIQLPVTGSLPGHTGIKNEIRLSVWVEPGVQPVKDNDVFWCPGYSPFTHWLFMLFTRMVRRFESCGGFNHIPVKLRLAACAVMTTLTRNEHIHVSN